VSLLAKALSRDNWTVQETKLNICPHIDLTGRTWDSYLATLGPNIRKNINRVLRNLPKNFDMYVEWVQTRDGAHRALDIVIELHQKRWAQAGTSEAFQSPSVIAFHREFVQLAAERGWLRILLLWLDGQPAACLYGLRYGNVFSFYQSGFDPVFRKESVGVATWVTISSSVEARWNGFLHGAEEYKFHWATSTRDLGRLELYPPHTRARIYRQVIDLNRAARRMVRRVLSKA
jgi:CelD/BcsL family acetyltransferase involved in cellulose biosynthesis